MRRAMLCMFVAIGSVGVVAAAGHAQDSAFYYSVMHPDATKTSWRVFYDIADKLTTATRAELRSTLDIPYGNDPRERLDVYQPQRKVANAPVLIFLHGGNFVEGDRSHYGYVAGRRARSIESSIQ